MPELHSEAIVAPGANPTRHLLLLHGILGSGGNWRGFARGLAAVRPAWSPVLVDLRMHGRSQGFAPPHTLAAAAADVAALGERLARDGRAVGAICGHSFGGKVALAARVLTARPTLVLDASPGAAPGKLAAAVAGSTAAVLVLLEHLPARWPRRDAFIVAAVERGLEQSVAAWLAQNLEPSGGELELRLDLVAIRALLEDYFACDLWPTVAAASPAAPIGFVVGGRSTSVSADERARLAAMPAVSLEILADAGHWLHVDAPGPLQAAVVAWLDRLPAS